MLQSLNDANFSKEVREATDTPVVVMYTGSWCQPCKRIKPDFEFLSNQIHDVKFMTADLDENIQSAQDLGIRSVPSFAIFIGGMIQDVTTVSQTKQQLRQWITDNS